MLFVIKYRIKLIKTKVFTHFFHRLKTHFIHISVLLVNLQMYFFCRNEENNLIHSLIIFIYKFVRNPQTVFRTDYYDNIYF